MLDISAADPFTADPDTLPEPIEKKELDKLPTIKPVSSDDKEVQIKITNNTGVDLSYEGFSAQRPWLNVSTYDGKKWVKVQYYFCGTGQGRYTLKNNSSVTIKLEAKKNIRFLPRSLTSKARSKVWLYCTKINPANKRLSAPSRNDFINYNL